MILVPTIFHSKQIAVAMRPRNSRWSAVASYLQIKPKSNSFSLLETLIRSANVQEVRVVVRFNASAASACNSWCKEKACCKRLRLSIACHSQITPDLGQLWLPTHADMLIQTSPPTIFYTLPSLSNLMNANATRTTWTRMRRVASVLLMLLQTSSSTWQTTVPPLVYQVNIVGADHSKIGVTLLSPAHVSTLPLRFNLTSFRWRLSCVSAMTTT